MGMTSTTMSSDLINSIEEDHKQNRQDKKQKRKQEQQAVQIEEEKQKQLDQYKKQQVQVQVQSHAIITPYQRVLRLVPNSSSFILDSSLQRELSVIIDCDQMQSLAVSNSDE